MPEAAWWLGIPGALYTLLLKLVGLVLALLAIIFLLQNRNQIADWIGGDGSRLSGWGRVRRTLAEIWQLLAIFYIAGLYAIYALHIEGGFTYVARATRAQHFGNSCGAGSRSFDPQFEPARVCRFTAPQNAISDA